MKNSLWRCALAVAPLFLSAAVHSSPIVFDSAQYETVVFAASGALSDVDSASSPPSPLPLISTATVVGTNDFATAFAASNPGLLIASTEADSFLTSQGATAGALSQFAGTFSGTGDFRLNFDFDNLTSLVGGAASAGTLLVAVTNTVGGITMTLFQEIFNAGGDFIVDLTSPGGVTTLDLLVFSQSTSSGDAQSAVNFAQVVFSGEFLQGPVPVSPPLPLVLLGLGAMFGVQVQRRGTARSLDRRRSSGV